MGKSLIITEKPSVARDYAAVLKVKGNRNGYMEDDRYVISWCYGHLVEMVYPESYDIKYKTWRLDDLPFLPKEYQYGVVASAKEQYAVVNSLLHRTDIDRVYWAGDSGKEGQTIEENIRQFGGVRAGMEELRVWIDSQTDEEILRGIKEARPMSDYALLGKSGVMRAIEDYSLGINFSRALSVKYGRLINDAAATDSYAAVAIGRVMTCVLGMVVNREREIRNFTETPFYRILGSFTDANFSAEWRAAEGSKYYNSPLLYKENGFKREEDANRLVDMLQGKQGLVESIENGTNRKKAPLLFNLAELQSECSKRFKISPAEALKAAQELYERKLTTYPRTDARVLTTAIAKEISKNLYGLKNYPPLQDLAGEILANGKYKGLEKSAYTDDKKVTDHYAIIPTGYLGGIDHLSSMQKAVYDLIARRFLAVFFPPAQYTTLKIRLRIETEPFFASARVLTDPGYLKVTGVPLEKEQETENEDEESCSKEALIALSKTLKQGDFIKVNELKLKEGKTSPPKRYTSGNLILAMENAGNLIEDEELREQIKNTGIGTSATRGEILEKLVRIKYLNQNGKTQIITPENLGEMIYEVVALSVPSLLNPEVTASWEKGLEGIVNGSVDYTEYRSKLEAYIRSETEKMIRTDLKAALTEKIRPFAAKGARGEAGRKPLNLPCPVCGGELTTTPFGYGCSNYFNQELKCDFSIGKIAGTELTEDQLSSLILNGSTDVIHGFTSKAKKKFSAKLKLEKDPESGKPSVVFDFEGVQPEELANVHCPICGGTIIKTSFGYGCGNYSREDPEHSCRFMISKIAGVKLTEKQVTALLTDEIVGPIKKFKSKTGKPFEAKLAFQRDDAGKFTGLRFVFDDQERELEGLQCPKCGKPIRLGYRGYRCLGNSQENPSCDFHLGKYCGVLIDEAQFTKLITEGRSDQIKGFVSKKGSAFDAALILDENRNPKFDFEPRRI